jgi:hypothetical protein
MARHLERLRVADPHPDGPADHAGHRGRRIAITDGPPMLKSENARPSGWVYVDVRGRDLASVAAICAMRAVAQVKLARRREHRLLGAVRISGAGQRER